jgi:putative flippase GtrA
MKTLVIRFTTFAGVGAVATIAQYIVLILLASGLGLPPVLSSTIGFAISAGLNYVLNYHLTFQSSAPHRRTAWRFAAMVLSGLVLNAGLMMVLSGGFGLHYLMAQLITTGLVLLWNFTISQWWTFARST